MERLTDGLIDGLLTVWALAVSMINAQVITVLVLTLLGYLFTMLFTQWRKSAIGRNRRWRIRSEAFAVGYVATFLLISAFAEGTPYAVTVLALFMGAVVGMGAPLSFDLFVSVAVPLALRLLDPIQWRLRRRPE